MTAMKSRHSLMSIVLSLAALFVVLVAVNILASRFSFRMDLTEDRAFTLSEGTRAILSRLEGPVQVRVYAGVSNGQLPPFLKNFTARVENLLKEMSMASGGLVQVERLDPQPDSDAEESASLDGIEPQPLPNGNTLTLGLSANMLDERVAIPFLPPDRERLLEYDIARAIARIAEPRRPAVGVMSPLPVMGQPMSMMMTGGQGPQPWVVVNELRRDFDVRSVAMTAPAIPEDIDCMVVIHPKDITPAAEYAIDRFVRRGGRLLVFLDPFCIFDGGAGPMPEGTSSTLPTLLPAWGIGFDNTRAVADLEYEGRTREGRAPGLLDLTSTAMNADDVLTADVDNLLLAFAGRYSGDPAEGLLRETLLESSTASQLVSPQIARMDPQTILRDFKASGERMPLAIRLTGVFPSAFPDGPPEGVEASGKEEAEPVESAVILVGDADMIQDPLSVTEVRGLFPGGRMFVPVNGNLGFAQSSVELLTGSDDLIRVRSRATRNRPFTVVRQLQAEAEQKFQETIRKLETSLQEAQDRLSRLQQGKEEGQHFILTEEQQREIERFRQEEANVKRQLKEVRRELRSEIDALEVRLKWLNIAALPALVIIAGLVFGIMRRRRSRAR
jgi:ABC-type uncharacterized transport system involved in gliding motility auxiliary subunit